MQEFKLPSLGADMDDGTLVAWKVKPGDKVKRGDVLAIVDTSKAAIDIESWQEGIVQELRVQPGDKFPVGTVMALLSSSEEKAATVTRLVPTPYAKPPLALVSVSAPAASTCGRMRISPAARKRAIELDIDPSTVSGSGMGGSITLQDVEATAAISAASSSASAQPVALTTDTQAVRAVSDRGAEMRKTIAAAMSRSKREIPHYYLGESIVLDKAVAWLHDWNATRPVTERVLLTALLLKAVARALRKFPHLNGFFINGNFTAAPAVHIGVAIALRNGGLIAPALLNADTKSISTLMPALNDLVQRARAGSLRSSELNAATITVTSLGEQSIEAVYGVIYPPQVALVGFGGVHDEVVAVDGGIKILPVVHASLAADHRVSDGQLGARFLQHLAALLQQPEALETEEDA